MQQRKKTTRKFIKEDELPKKTELSFYDKVYIVASQIPKGKVTSYGAIAKKLGDAKLRAACGTCNGGSA